MRNAKLTICRSPLNLQDTIQQRILDCGALGGLILTDYREVLEEHFKLDEELFVYRDCDELRDKVKFLMDNPSVAEKSKKMLQENVLKRHTWHRRMMEFLSLIK